MYTLDELREAGRAVVELIDLEVDNSYKCFSELFEKGSVLLPLYQKMKRMST